MPKRLGAVTNAIEAGICRQGDSGWAWAVCPGGGGGYLPPFQCLPAGAGAGPLHFRALQAKSEFIFGHKMVPDGGDRPLAHGEAPDEQINVSSSVLRLILYLSSLRDELRYFLEDMGQGVLDRLVRTLGARLGEEEFWVETYKQHYVLQGTYAHMEHLSLVDTYQVPRALPPTPPRGLSIYGSRTLLPCCGPALCR